MLVGEYLNIMVTPKSPYIDKITHYNYLVSPAMRDPALPPPGHCPSEAEAALRLHTRFPSSSKHIASGLPKLPGQAPSHADFKGWGDGTERLQDHTSSELRKRRLWFELGTPGFPSDDSI
jgi:hypothetical protein